MPDRDKQKRAERLQLMLTLDEIDAVERWRFEHRMPSRSAAVRSLMNLGLNSETAQAEPDILIRDQISSSEIGVVDNSKKVERALGLDPGAETAILVAGSDALIAHGLKNLLSEAGFAPIGPMLDFADAEKELKQTNPAATVLDLHADDAGAMKFARSLNRRGVPLLICTDEATTGSLPGTLKSVSIVSRLSAVELLGDAVRSLLASGTEG